jgi:DNA-binding NarL/FixJ family response regulator
MSLPFKKRVVIVEDDQEIRESFNLIVNSSQRFTVVGAYGNCEDAIAALNRDKPEIVLMDIELPGMNGIRGTQIIRDKSANTEIIMVTVYETWYSKPLRRVLQGTSRKAPTIPSY